MATIKEIIKEMKNLIWLYEKEIIDICTLTQCIEWLIIRLKEIIGE